MISCREKIVFSKIFNKIFHKIFNKTLPMFSFSTFSSKHLFITKGFPVFVLFFLTIPKKPYL